MAESQDNRPKPKKPEENDDRPTSATSQDSKTYASDDPNTEKQREGNKSNKVQHKKDCDDGNSSQAESELQKPKGNNNNKTKKIHEKIENLESGKKKDNTVEDSKAESYRQGQGMIDKSFGSTPEENDKMGGERIQEESCQMESTKRKPGCNVREAGKLKNTCTALEQENPSKVHSAAVMGNSRQEPPASQSKKDGHGVVCQRFSGGYEETEQEKETRTMRDPKNLEISYSAITKKSLGPETCNPKPLATKVEFYLLVPEENFVDRAFIHFGPDNSKPLQRVSEDLNLWKYSQELHGGSLEYKYSVYSKTQEFKFSLLKLFNKDWTRYEESDERSLKVSSAQFDVFTFPKDTQYSRETLPKGILVYVKFMLGNINPSSAFAILAGINSLRFLTFNPKHSKECINWILEQATCGLVTDVQRFYLCIVLSYLDQPLLQLLFPEDSKTVEACDRLLHSLNACVDYDFLSTSHRERLKIIAVMLVMNSSRPSWLILAAHFYPYVGIEFVLKKKHEIGVNYTIGNKEYLKMAASLLSKIAINVNCDIAQLINLVVKSAPNWDAVLELFKSPAVERLFTSKNRKMEIFLKYCESTTRCNSKSAGTKLVAFHNIPAKFRLRMRKRLVSILLEYARSNNELNTEHEEIFLQLIKSGHLDKDQIVQVLMELSKSKSVLCQNLLLKILSKEKEIVEYHWYNMDFLKKKEICQFWINTRVDDKLRASGLIGAKKVAATYEAVDAIMRCSLTNSNTNLAQHVSGHVVATILRNEGVLSFFEALARIEKCTDVVQECYISHVRKKLKKDFKTVKKPSMFLKECPNSRLRQKLLSCILEVAGLPNISQNCIIVEDHFRIILNWCNIWIILFATTGMHEKSEKYQIGKKICQKLAMCIKEGQISPGCLEEVNKEKEKVSAMCANVLNTSMSENDIVDFQTPILKQISKFVLVIQDCSQNIELLESVINFGKRISNGDISGTKAIIGMFSILKKTWRDKEMHELQDGMFWRELRPLLSLAKDLQPLVTSVSFMTVAKKCLTELSNASVDDDGNEAVGDFYSLMKFLITKAISDFQMQWNPFLDDPGSISVETMKTLLGPLKDGNQLDGELELLAKYFGAKFSLAVKTNIKDYVKYPNVLARVKNAVRTLQVFGYEDSSNELMDVCAQLENNDEITLAQLNHAMQEVKQIVSSFSGENLDGVIKQLARSRELLDFIEEIIDEDIRFLIDAVEEHSDQFLSVSSVSDLIDVHGFLAPLIKRKNEEECSPRVFLETVKTSCLGHKDIATKIEQCSWNVNSLRGLYTNIANRGEVTKEIIHNCLQNGVYLVSQEGGKCETKMTYVLPEKDERNYHLPELHDLRSRAHLIVTSRNNTIKMALNHSSESKGDIDFDYFINQVNLVTEISTLLSKLRSSGYTKYRDYLIRMKTTDDLQTNKETLQNDLDNWENILKKARENFYFLNYYNSDQLCMLYNFLMNESDAGCDNVLSLIHFVDSTITEQQLLQYRGSQKLKQLDTNNPDLLLSTVGEALQIMFSTRQSVIRWISNDDQSQSNSTLDATVAPGEIFVATLEPKSLLMANVVLELYKNTSNAFPEPYQIVFCGSQTTWEELHLLLQRCFAHSQNIQQESLFCIANVELLPNELQFRLVDAIKKKQAFYRTSKIKTDACYQLALICRGGDHHHIVEQFAQYSHHIAGMSDLDLTRHLKSSWPDVKIIASTLPGLGKTEQIKCEAAEKNMNVVSCPISGPFEPSKLIQRLKELKVTKYQCLHLDISDVPVGDPLILDNFLFQLVVTGMVSDGNQFYHLPTTHVYIEIANTLKDWLQESLVVLKYFTRTHLEWNGYEDFIVSTKITSNTQVVCQYLDLFDRDCLECKEVKVSGPEKLKPLPAHRCRELLAKYFSSDAYTNFTTLRTFLRVLADQLLKFSKSAFFKIENLDAMVGEETQDIRKNLFQALLQVSKDFARRAIRACPSSNTQNLSKNKFARALQESARALVTSRSAEDMVERVKGMIKWEDSNHLLVVFHGLNSQAITAAYRNKYLVPSNVEKLLKSQLVGENKELEDFNNFTQEQLQEKLKRIVCMKQSERKNLSSRYALTPDNILKMILVILRVRVNIPVIIMGETGCGKTSLVRYLANTCGVQFCPFNVHAGISEETIISFIKEKEAHARDTKQQIWIFLDEINTCDYLGLLSDIMCHHSLLGRPLSKYLVFIAACNPYKERSLKHIRTAGLESKNIGDECSKLVYRVHPLPETIIDYVWDYGALAPKDERDYIRRMVKELPHQYEDMLVDLLAASQEFIRGTEKNSFCVSLRDVNRCIHLISWFQEMMNKRQKLSILNSERFIHLRKYYSMSEEYNNRPMIKSIVLALAHCYMSRLPTADLRKDYRGCMMSVFRSNETMMKCSEYLDPLEAIVRMEEEDYLNRMELPKGTAKNAALRENVFVMLVCILNRIPVFVVGKPGCSKSLSIQLIRSNLRGRDSKDPLFKQLPQLYVVSYQGSESSTSEGIEKVFKKARKYKSHNKDGNILPVVLLDEVGLAENSKYNPLKVLHSLLEPGEGKLPDVAVVGISNWSLDAAKMNRAIHLSRPEPTKEDLYDTGCSLHYADGTDNNQHLKEEELQCLAEAYFEYQHQQTHANFHGLRDYYSLIKSLTGSSDFDQVNTSLQRNFGGLPTELTNIQKIFLDKLKKLMIRGSQDIVPVTQLIQKNLEDRLARHLMLITSGDSAIGILKQTLAQLQKETITIYGSRFEEDLSEEYNYRILSRAILCMEQDCILILKDLESIYGSLYDMLNQNYAVVGSRKSCRVALGAYSNPMCQVNEGFRCIVLVDEHKVNDSDPPFLNRFEKQVLRFSDVLSDDQQSIIADLRRWVQGMSTVEGLESHFKETDMFIGFYKDTLPSLVYSQGYDKDCSPEELLKKCKDELMWTASPDGVLRTQKCNLSKENFEEVQDFSDEYLKKPLHQGFASFMEHVKTKHQETSFFASDEVGSKTVVMTFSNIHTDIRQCLGSSFSCQVERLSAYKSEKQLAERINEFWNAPEKELLVLQCKPDLDGTHLLLSRSIIEEKRNSYKQCLSETKAKDYKHVCIVMHVQRGEVAGVAWQFNFLCGWRQVFLDVLEAPLVPLNKIIGNTVQKLLTSSVWPIGRIAQNDLLWCFTCIKYTESQQRINFLLCVAKSLFESKKISQVIERLILESIDLNGSKREQETYTNENWHVQVACDRQLLVNSSTLNHAMEQFVSRLVRNPLAKIVYFLEKENAWPPHLVVDANETHLPKLEVLWCQFIMNGAIFRISDIPEPLGAESYVLDSTNLDLCLPFSQILMKKVDSIKNEFLKENATLIENEDNLDDNYQLKQTVRQQQLERFSKMIISLVPELLCVPSDCYNLYMKDVFDITTAGFSPMLSRPQRVSVVQAMFVSKVKKNLPAKDMPDFITILHIFLWVHREEILDLLRMVDCCQPFVPLKVLSNVISDVFESVNEVMFVKFHDTSDSLDDESFTIEEAATNETDTLPETASNPEQDADEFEQTKTILGDFESDWNKPSPDFQENPEAFEGEIDKEVVTEEETENGNSKRFGDVLVTAYCEEMFPSKETVERNGGLEPWIRNANLLLSLAFKFSEQSPAFHYLRLCLDFSRIIITSAAIPTSLSSLYIFNEIGTALRPEYLDHEESFTKITNQIIQPLKEDMKNQVDKQKALQKFLGLFYGRCIDTNADTSAVRPIVEQVLSLERPDLVMMMNQVFLRLFLVEKDESPDIFTDLIINPGAIENCPCLQNIDEVFKDRFLNGLIRYDSYPAVMICDLIQSVLDSDNRFEIDDIDGPECRILTLARAAKVLLLQNKEDGCGLRVFSSVTFLRGFFKMMAQFIADNPMALKKDSAHKYFMTEVVSLLKDSKLSLQIFFLKQLHERVSRFDLQKLFSEGNVLSPITELWCGEKIEDKAVFSSVFKCSEYEKITAAYCMLISNDDSYMHDFLMECTSSANHAFALLGILINMVYLKRAVRKLTDKEEELVDWFVGEVSCFPFLLQELLLRIVGRRDFHCPQLQLSIESSVEEVEMALLVLHIACVVAIGRQSEMLPMYRYFTNPALFELPCVLTHCKEEMRSVFEYQSSIKNSVCVTCPCGLRLAFKGNVNEKVCPQCHEVLNDEANNSKSSQPPETLLVTPNSGLRPEWDLSTESMSPGAYCALHFIVYSSYYAGIALGTSSEQNLSAVLNLLWGLDVESDSIIPANLCFKKMENDLLCLMKILSCNKNVAIKTMHLVVEKSSDLIRGDHLLEANDCSTPTMRREWESMFSQLTETVLLNARETSKEVKEMMKLQQTVDSGEITLECRILELDNYPEKPKEQNQQLKRLFRVTKQPCLEDFRSAFLYSPTNVKEKHTFLTLFFAKFNQLLIIGHLYHLLKWSRLVSSAVSHRISRKDAQSKTINDFISGHLLESNHSQKGTESLKKSFEKFKIAWNEMRPLVNEVLKDKGDMPRLKETNCLAYCLTESEWGLYLQTAIDILVSHQNSILDATISLPSNQHLALSFIEKQHSKGVACTSIQNVEENEIISFQWSDDLFQQHAKNNLEYGKGQEIMYDFERMEIELATEIVFGKCYLTGTLNKFIFANELFHSSGPLLTEIRSQLAQSPRLPDEVQIGLSNLKERRIKEAQDLLQHIEVLIFLLREFQNFNVEMTLEELAQKWLPSPFPVTLLPEPRSSIKIKHVAVLYEAVEDLLADGAIDGLADKFRDNMTGDIRQAVAGMLDKEIDQLKPANFLKALRRFVFRYLSSDNEKYWLAESTELQSCLKEASLWFPHDPPNPHEIPGDLTLEYTYSIIKYLEEIEKERKGITIRTDLRSPARQSQTVKQLGRRRLAKFSRS